DPAKIHPFLAEIGKDKRKSNRNSGNSIDEGHGLDTGAAALHLAVRCASVDTVALLLSHRAISPNGIHPPGSGNTVLHLAASLGRVDVVNLLLEQDGIDDTIRDAQGRTCRDVARGREVIAAIQDSHAFLNASYRSLLRSYILSPPNSPAAPALVALLESPRAHCVDLAYLDDGSGNTLLHEAALRKDLRLIELAVRAGADVFGRNRRGKTAAEGARDERVRAFLRQFANHDSTLIEPTLTSVLEPPVLKGYLNKYTNVARGYNTRWFVLKNGILSYYRHQDDETVASRGSISMKSAQLNTRDRVRIDVQSDVGQPKWYLKANHPVEAARWAAALERSIAWARATGVGQNGHTNEVGGRRRSGESDSSGLRSVSLRSTRSQKGRTAGTLRISGTLLRRAVSGEGSATSTDVECTAVGDASPDLNQGPSPADESLVAADDADDEGFDGQSSGAESNSRAPPHEEAFELQGNSTTAQMDLTAQLLGELPPGEIQAALGQSFAELQSMLAEYVDMARTRETWWRKTLAQERKQQKFWEESLATVVREGETLEQELRARSRRRGSRFFDLGGELTARPKRASFGGTVSIVEDQEGEEQEYFPDAAETPILERPPPRTVPKRTQTQDTVTATTSVALTPTPTRTPTVPMIMPMPSPRFPSTPSYNAVVEDEDADTDEEDEFFDAIETGTLPNLVVPEALASPRRGALTLAEPLELAPYDGYKHLRTSLDLNEERPSTSLWSVLKHSIGKDLTKISFPVFFNEPTSMLQRMAEDMEFTECLDAAARDKDPLRRLAFVAAFAMSNYSSTIGRIAKPFNPMLSETFEYVRLDKEYRYVSEQVSHHPPISACWAESPSWHYFGEVDAQNKFMGKSFEIRPTGIAHAELIIPEERGGPGYPKASGRFGAGKVVEHYSWKKVTTNVSGFILGSPTIDHYGDMIVRGSPFVASKIINLVLKVKNHRTGDECILTFKPRGWRGKDAFEIAGEVITASGRVVYKLAGRWNSQLIASPAGSTQFLNPDLEVSGASSPNSVANAPFVLWRNTEKPVGSPFNLTPFAITLNDCPEDTLRPYLCPTDCRLRPDQRAFEMGKWELANDLKNEQEQKQRAIRKAREMGEMPPHRPRWFRAETDGDTGERVWTPSRVGDVLEYWAERERVYSLGGTAKAHWKDVDDIFIETPEDIKLK
ncbi:hypothetical protein H0H81_011080, partial [Sphagnurus paluster]